MGTWRANDGFFDIVCAVIAEDLIFRVLVYIHTYRRPSGIQKCVVESRVLVIFPSGSYREAVGIDLLLIRSVYRDTYRYGNSLLVDKAGCLLN